MTSTKNKTTRAKQIAKKAAPAKVEPKAPTRADLLTLLDKHGYTGPRSYTATTLSAVVEWLDAKAPKDQTADLPDGVVFAVHPDLRPALAPKSPRLSKGYLAALADVLDHMDSDEGGGDVRQFCTDRLASA